MFRILTSAALLAIMACLTGSSSCAAADPTVRTALVIGNAAYPDNDATLVTPLGDQQLFADALKRQGFTVAILVNATKATMTGALEHLLSTIKPGSIAVVFFAGEGIQVAGKNYLLPVDAKIWTEADVVRDGVSLDRLVGDVASHGAKATAVILDAARRNPFERRFRSVSAGLAPLSAVAGTLSIVATAPGTLVDDDPKASNGLFATELSKAITTPGLDAEQAFAHGRDVVSAQTSSRQNPAIVSGLDETFSFAPDTVTAASASPAPAPREPGPGEAKSAPPPSAAATAAVAADQTTSAAPIAEPPPPVKTDGPSPPMPGAVTASTAAASASSSPTSAPKQVAAFEPKAPISRPAAASLPDQPTPAAATPLSADEAKTKAALDDRIARNAADEAAFFERGRLLAEHNDYLLALADFDRSISLDPKDAEAFNNRCWTRAIVDQLQTALDDCNAAIRLRANYADAHDSRGLVLLKQGVARAALLDYDAALKIDPKHSSALYGRGIAKLRLGQNDEAEKDIANAIALDPGVERSYAHYGLK